MPFPIVSSPFILDSSFGDPGAFVRALHDRIEAVLNETHTSIMKLRHDDKDHPAEFYRETLKDYRPGLSNRDLSIISIAVNVYQELVDKRNEQRSQNGITS